MSEKDLFKELHNFLQGFDKHLESKINTILLKHLSIKWQSLSLILTLILAVSAIQVATLFYVNDKTIKSGIETAIKNSKQFQSLKDDVNSLKTDVNSLKTDVNSLKTDVNSLKENMKALIKMQNNREPKSISISQRSQKIRPPRTGD